MPDKYHAHQSIFIVTLFCEILTGVSYSTELSPVEQTLQFIENCMDCSPAPWTDEWKKEYLETIRSVIDSHRDASFDGSSSVDVSL